MEILQDLEQFREPSYHVATAAWYLLAGYGFLGLAHWASWCVRHPEVKAQERAERAARRSK